MNPRVALAAGAMLALAVPLPAQDSVPPGHVCLQGHPPPRCGLMLLTNAGVYLTTAHRDYSSTHVPIRVALDWGILINLGPSDAIGVSYLVSIDNDDLITVPMLRYRRWLAAGDRSMDVGFGIGGTGSGEAGPRVSTLLKWNVNSLHAVVLRPEIRRLTTDQCSYAPYQCQRSARDKLVVSLGYEASGPPGLAISGGFFAVFLALVSLVASAD
jgi:hypothetical protein